MMAVFTFSGRFSDTGYVVGSEDRRDYLEHALASKRRYIFVHGTGHPWFAQEWLSQLTIYGAYKLGGYSE